MQQSRRFSIAIIFIILFIFPFLACNVNPQQKRTIAKPTIIQYPNVQPQIIETKTFKITEIFDCNFNDPAKDSGFMKNLEANIADPVLRQLVMNNHYGALVSFSTPDHPSGSDTVFYPAKDPAICDILKNAKVFSVQMISCTGDHYPPCWFGLNGLVNEVK